MIILHVETYSCVESCINTMIKLRSDDELLYVCKVLFIHKDYSHVASELFWKEYVTLLKLNNILFNQLKSSKSVEKVRKI